MVATATLKIKLKILWDTVFSPFGRLRATLFCESLGTFFNVRTAPVLVFYGS